MNGAPGFIKFALGENVKRSNGGENNTRYPNTRMGVEQVYVNAFQISQFPKITALASFGKNLIGK